MSRKHLFSIVVLLGAATVAGVIALTSTRQLGASTTQVSSAQVAARSRSLDRLEASLQRSLAKQPPAVPAVRRPAPQRSGASGPRPSVRISASAFEVRTTPGRIR